MIMICPSFFFAAERIQRRQTAALGQWTNSQSGSGAGHSYAAAGVSVTCARRHSGRVPRQAILHLYYYYYYYYLQEVSECSPARSG